MNPIRTSLTLILAAFALLIHEFDRWLLRIIESGIKSMVNSKPHCLVCGIEEESIKEEFPFCKKCTPEVEEELKHNGKYTPPPEEKNSPAYQ